MVPARAGAVVGRHRGRALRRFDPATGQDRSWPMPSRIGCFALREAGGLVVALENGFHFYDLDQRPARGRSSTPRRDKPGNRFNDGTTDPAGRFIAGTMPMGPREPVAALYRLWPGGRCEQAVRRHDGDQRPAPSARTGGPSTSPIRWRTCARSGPATTTPASGAIGERRVFVDTHGLRRPARRRHGRRRRLLLDGRRRRLAAGPLHARRAWST